MVSRFYGFYPRLEVLLRQHCTDAIIKSPSSLLSSAHLRSAPTLKGTPKDSFTSSSSPHPLGCHHTLVMLSGGRVHTSLPFFSSPFHLFGLPDILLLLLVRFLCAPYFVSF
eukprot:RCo035921